MHRFTIAVALFALLAPLGFTQEATGLSAEGSPAVTEGLSLPAGPESALHMPVSSDGTVSSPSFTGPDGATSAPYEGEGQGANISPIIPPVIQTGPTECFSACACWKEDGTLGTTSEVCNMMCAPKPAADKLCSATPVAEVSGIQPPLTFFDIEPLAESLAQQATTGILALCHTPDAACTTPATSLVLEALAAKLNPTPAMLPAPIAIPGAMGGSEAGKPAAPEGEGLGTPLGDLPVAE